MRSGINRSSLKCVAFNNMISEEIALAEPYEPLRNSGKINRNCPDKIKCQILSRQICISSFASFASKLSNSVNFWSAWAHKSGQHSLPMDKNPDRQDSSEVVQWKYLNPRVSQKKEKTIILRALIIRRTQFNYTLLVAFVTNDWQVKHCFVYLVDFVKSLPGWINSVLSALGDLPRPKFVRS